MDDETVTNRHSAKVTFQALGISLLACSTREAFGYAIELWYRGSRSPLLLAAVWRLLSAAVLVALISSSTCALDIMTWSVDSSSAAPRPG